MDDLMHKLVSGAITGGLIALVGALSVANRRRRANRAQAAAPVAGPQRDGAPRTQGQGDGLR